MGHKSSLIFSTLLLAMLVAGCTGYQASSDQKPVGIAVDRQNYTPIMSSTVGIGLTPVYPRDIDNGSVNFLWQADYGYFINWGGARLQGALPAGRCDDG